ncbi:MAG TPA: hypothetical protein VMO26_22220 [Vicinamibacterales bacterium]|nr:hypothetical protein [Vicinamibacterales bacterium]
MKPPNSFDIICTDLAQLLAGSDRHVLVAEAASAETLGPALLSLRASLRAHIWTVGGQAFDFARAIEKLDRKTRQIGFHVMNDWDGIADRVNDDIIPVDVLDYLIERRGDEPVSATTLSMLLDYYFMHVLALLSVRVWDEGDPDVNMGRVNQLLRLLQGPDGSGQPFVADAETLLLIATSHYEMYERGYAVLLDHVRTLDDRHQTNIALGHAASMGCHLRFGFEATYGRDTINMRDDNVADYPWLLYALNTLMQQYVRLRETGEAAAPHDALVEALINGLSGDARAFVGKAPTSLAGFEGERARFREAFYAYKQDLLAAFEAYRPTEHVYSPLSFFFNFSHNVVKGTVIDALLEGRPWPITFNHLLTGRAGETAPLADREHLARTLMDYARANPHSIRGRLMPVIVYDPGKGRQAYGVAMRKLREG